MPQGPTPPQQSIRVSPKDNSLPKKSFPAEMLSTSLHTGLCTELILLGPALTHLRAWDTRRWPGCSTKTGPSHRSSQACRGHVSSASSICGCVPPLLRPPLSEDTHLSRGVTVAEAPQGDKYLWGHSALGSAVFEKPKPLFLIRSQPSGKPVGHWGLGVCDLRDDLHSPCPGLRRDRHRRHHGQGRTRGSRAPRSSFHHCQGGPQSPLRLHAAHSQRLTDRGGCSVPTGLRGLQRNSHAVLRDPPRGEAALAPPCTPQQPALSYTAGEGGPSHLSTSLFKAL